MSVGQVGKIGGRPDARIILLERPAASPGCCIICGKSEHPVGFAEAGLDVEFYGAINFCGDCAGDMARLFGFIGPVDYQALCDSNAALQLENEGYEARLSALGAVENAITGYLTDYGTIVDSGSNLRSVLQSAESDSQLPSDEPKSVDPITERPNLTVVEGSNDSTDVASVLTELGID